MPQITPNEMLRKAAALPPRDELAPYRKVIDLMRRKGYSWREIADELNAVDAAVIPQGCQKEGIYSLDGTFL